MFWFIAAVSASTAWSWAARLRASARLHPLQSVVGLVSRPLVLLFLLLLLLLRCTWVRSVLQAALHLDRGDLHAPPPGQGKGDALLVISTLVDEESVQGLGPLVAQGGPREGLEQGVIRTEETEILVL